MFGASAWGLSRALTLLAAILTATVAVRWGQSQLSGIRSISTAKAFTLRMVRSREAPLVLFLLGYAGELVLYGFVGGLFDRYLYPLVPVAAILLMRRIPRPFAREPIPCLRLRGAHVAFGHGLRYHGQFVRL